MDKKIAVKALTKLGIGVAQVIAGVAVFVGIVAFVTLVSWGWIAFLILIGVVILVGAFAMYYIEEKNK